MKKVGLKVGLSILIICIIVLSGLYLFFNTHYIPNTILDYGFNKIDVSYKGFEEVSDIIYSDLNDFSYNLIVSENEEIPLGLLDVASVFTSEDIVNILKEEKEKNNYFTQNFTIDMKDYISISKDNIELFVEDLKEFLEETPKKSEDAYITYDEENKEYIIIPEIVGNVLISDTSNILFNEISNYNLDLNLKELGCFEMPNILKDDEILLSNLETFKKYENFSLTYLFADKKEVIDISVWNKWVIPQYSDSNPDLLNPDLPLVLDENYVQEYVVNLGKRYNTIGITRTFVTSTGEVIEISTGDYGWLLNRDKMIEDINNHFYEIKSEEKEAIFKQKAICFGENDFKDSYVEVSIENQRVWMYVNGECIVDTPVVTGNISKGHNTRKGVFSLTYKTRNATLRGADYASFVYYWMPFDGGIGLHDATWRYSFGGNIYKTNGSHGCVNMPLESAKTVYNNLESNMPIIVW